MEVKRDSVIHKITKTIHESSRLVNASCFPLKVSSDSEFTELRNLTCLTLGYSHAFLLILKQGVAFFSRQNIDEAVPREDFHGQSSQLALLPCRTQR